MLKPYTRQEERNLQYVAIEQQDGCPVSPVTAQFSNTKSSNLLVSYDHGYYNPDYKSQVAERKDAGTPREAQKVKVKTQYGFLQNSRVCGTPSGFSYCRIEGLLGYHPEVINVAFTGADNSASDDSLVNAVTSKFIKRLFEASETFNGGTFFGEIAETLNMFRHGFFGYRGKLLEYLKKANPLAKKGRKTLRRRRTKSSKSALERIYRDLTDLYLEAMFGIQPFVNDMENAVSVLNGLVARSKIVSVSSRSVRLNSAYSDNLNLSMNSLTTTGWVQVKATHKVARRSSMSGSLRLDNPTFLGNLGLGLKDFAPTVWEVIPFSFVVDYFSNFQEWILGLTYTPVLDWWYRTDKNTLSIDWWLLPAFSNYHSNTVDKASVTSCKTQYTCDHLVRVVRPSLNINLAVESPLADSLKWLNLGFLSAQFAKPRGKPRSQN